MSELNTKKQKPQTLCFSSCYTWNPSHFHIWSCNGIEWWGRDFCPLTHSEPILTLLWILKGLDRLIHNPFFKEKNLLVSLFPLHLHLLLLPGYSVWPHAELSPLTGLLLQIPTYPGAQMLCSRINSYFLHSTKETGLFSEQHNPWGIVSYGAVPGLVCVKGWGH